MFFFIRFHTIVRSLILIVSGDFNIAFMLDLNDFLGYLLFL